MPDVKVSGMPADASPTLDDLVMIVDTTNGENRRVTLSDLADLISNNLSDGSVTADDIDFSTGVGWEEIARTTLGVAGDTITVDSIPPRKYLMIVVSGIASGGTLDTTFRFNNDSGTNYAHRYSTNHGAETAAVSKTNNPFESGSTDSGSVAFHYLYVLNIGTESKLLRWLANSEDATGGATNPAVISGFGKWANTSVQISRFDWLNTGTGDVAIGSEVVIYGRD